MGVGGGNGGGGSLVVQGGPDRRATWRGEVSEGLQVEEGYVLSATDADIV